MADLEQEYTDRRRRLLDAMLLLSDELHVATDEVKKANIYDRASFDKAQEHWAHIEYAWSLINDELDGLREQEEGEAIEDLTLGD
jgi:hypothetical protein